MYVLVSSISSVINKIKDLAVIYVLVQMYVFIIIFLFDMDNFVWYNVLGCI